MIRQAKNQFLLSQHPAHFLLAGSGEKAVGDILKAGL